MFKQIRTLMSEDLQLEGPTVEMDEMYYGGVRKHGTGRPMRGDKKKTPVVGIVERKGRAVAKVADGVSSGTLLGMVREHILPESMIYTDELTSYGGIEALRDRNNTGDKAIETDPINRQAVIDFKAKVFLLEENNSRAVEWASAIIVGRRRLVAVAHGNDGPFFASVRKNSNGMIFKVRRP